MPLKLMYITNDPDIARIAEENGVDRIFVDMEYIGKNDRQGGMDTVQNHHTVADVTCLRQVLQRAELLVRCNPIHEKTEEYGSSDEEIEEVIKAGAAYTWAEFEALTVIQQEKFIEWFDSAEAFEAWMEKVQEE